MSNTDRAQRERQHREAFAWLYQWAGAKNAPVSILDNLIALAQGEPLPHEWQYPAMPDEAPAPIDHSWDICACGHARRFHGNAEDVGPCIHCDCKYPNIPSDPTPTERTEVRCFVFPWTVQLSVDEEGDTIARFTDAPPNIHLLAHGKDANEALEMLSEIVKTYQEMEAEEKAPMAETITYQGVRLSEVPDMAAQITALEAELRQLRAAHPDTVRLDWLENLAEKKVFKFSFWRCLRESTITLEMSWSNTNDSGGSTIREAIDAAIAEKGGV